MRPESNIINLLLSGSASNCEILFALFRWDKDQRLFEGSPAFLKAFACPSGGGCISVDWSFLFPFLYLIRALRFVVVVVEHAVVLLLYLVLNLHPSFYLH